MVPHDYHIHSNFSCDSQASMSSMCRAAMEASIPEVGITEHLDLHPKDPCKGFFKVDMWWEELSRCRKEFNDVLSIRAGIELSEPHQHPQEIGALMEQYPWDYTIGALHWVGDEMIFEESYFRRMEQVAYDDYFSELLRMVEAGNFDILAHMDIVKRYGYENYGKYDPSKNEGEIRSILKILAAKDIALEINTAPLRRSVKETAPSKQILEWFREEGGKWITLGSDSHEPENVGAGIEKTLAIVRNIGFDAITSFIQRQPRSIPLW